MEKGKISHKSRKLVCGVGINDSDYVTEYNYIGENDTNADKWFCPYMRKWRLILQRCYNGRSPQYKDCTVCEEWLTFSNFKSWMEKQDWEGKHLDKDILVEGNRMYSPDTCCFVDVIINNFVVRPKNKSTLIGAYLNKKSGRYISHCEDPFKRFKSYLGSFDTEEEAHLAWRKAKLKYLEDLFKEGLIPNEKIKNIIKRRIEE